LIVENLSKVYPSGDGELRIFDKLSFELSRGESLAVTGPSGTGKSTLLHILGTLDSPTSGEIRLLNENPFALNESGQAEFRRRHIGFVFQDHQLLPQLNVLENTLVPALAVTRPTDEQRGRALELLSAVGLEKRIDHLPSELSGGERARVAVARSLLLKPSLILADEPTGNLDPANAKRIGGLLLELQKHENTLLIVVTHSSDLAHSMSRQMPIHTSGG
jgi:lipoprotein-releasing system ATP-binding protein